jgi:pimeloyl-ACP methyl ester carboxylesterase
MSLSTPATTSTEFPVFFDTSDATLLGILTTPVGPRRNIAVIILPGGGTPLATNVNRFSVRFCRMLAAEGFHAFRFDYHGVGESTGDPNGFHLAAPFVADVEGAMRAIEADGVERIVIVGSCFGARTALSAAAKNPSVIGLALICLPIRDFEMGERVATRMAGTLSAWDYLKRALRPRTLRRLVHQSHRTVYWQIGLERLRRARSSSSRSLQARYHVSPNVLESLHIVEARKVRTLLIYGEEDDFLTELQAQSTTFRFLDDSDVLTTRVLPGKLHGFPSVGGQEAVLHEVLASLCN